MDDSEFLIIGSGGQLGTALKSRYLKAQSTDTDTLDITSHQALQAFDWSKVSVILNAAAYTNVDGAETNSGQVAAWQVNAQAVAYLTNIARQHNITLVHMSTDYVFNGVHSEHAEDEPFSPLSVYGASKAAGDLLVSTLSQYYILRTSWVIGEGNNFVRTMLGLAKKEISPTVVADQLGRPTFTGELVRVIDHLLTNKAAFGTYNVSNGGPTTSWANIAQQTFELAGSKLAVSETTTEQYYRNKSDIAPRPLNSRLSLSKLESIGFEPHNWQDDLKAYVKKEMS